MRLIRQHFCNLLSLGRNAWVLAALAAEAGIQRSRDWYHVDKETYGEDFVPPEDVMPAYLVGAAWEVPTPGFRLLATQVHMSQPY